jgi:hypothetical protein
VEIDTQVVEIHLDRPGAVFSVGIDTYPVEIHLEPPDGRNALGIGEVGQTGGVKRDRVKGTA